MNRYPHTSLDICARKLRDVFGRFGTGVAVITTQDGSCGPSAVTINSFVSLSLDPPLVGFSLGRQARCLQRFLDTDEIAISVLRHDQRRVAANFARPSHARWHEMPLNRTASGQLIVGGALAALECLRVRALAAGDHLMFVLRVTAVHLGENAQPLLFFRSDYGSFVPDNDAASAELRRARHDAEVAMGWG